MTRIFLDANILVSVLNKEYPLFTYSSRILSLANHTKFEVYTSPLCLAIAFYFAQKKNKINAKQKIDVLCRHIRITHHNSDDVFSTLINKRINDFEDGLEYYAALSVNCDYIITEDTDDFYFSEIAVLSCKDFFDRCMIS
ncbi:type II toxin-antitoxin system VapC family toxin [Pedobacter montanisoli]|uniref:PIN domain-containing protein n=1 Tax=Pedobacter montanisoli TaxID=2923277 RepID=A0ABS9ZY31_9SPHI|nr:PIN domain-containing protein [Pedobacter montanisoli]MCJ0743215.1 PIN domain-containing protein [Pedobacter montanisoli]